MKLQLLIMALIASLLLSGCQGLPTGMFVSADGSSEPVTATKSIPLESPVVDSDNDGVKDELDVCTETPAEETVNEEGCSCSQLTLDDDNVCTTDVCVDGIITNEPLNQLYEKIVCPQDKCEEGTSYDYSESGWSQCITGELVEYQCTLTTYENNSCGGGSSSPSTVTYSGGSSSGRSSATTTTVEDTTTTTVEDTTTTTVEADTTTTTVEQTTSTTDVTTTTQDTITQADECIDNDQDGYGTKNLDLCKNEGLDYCDDNAEAYTEEECNPVDNPSDVPEFSVISSALVLLGAGIYINRKKQ